MGCFFSHRNVKETKGLTDKDKKLLYAPPTKTIEIQTDITFDSTELAVWT